MRSKALAVSLGANLILVAASLAESPAAVESAKNTPSTAAAKPTATKPLWRDLSARQQKALQSLAPYWDKLTEPHKRKWLALSRNYDRLSPAKQEVLHSRMTEWAGLSKQQRAQARLNFANVKHMPVDERKAKWKAYQALSDEEKSKLAARAQASKPPGAAPTIHPVPKQKLAPLPAVALDGQHRLRTPSPPAAPTPTAALLPVLPPPSKPEAAPQTPEPPATAAP